MTDEIILEGFRSLAQAMAEGFDRQHERLTAELTAKLTAVFTTQIATLRSEMNQRFAESEQRSLRHFDRRDERLDDHERRITTLEATR